MLGLSCRRRDHHKRRREAVEAAGLEADAKGEECGRWTPRRWMETTSHRKRDDGEEARYRGAEEEEEAAAAGVREEEEEEGAKH